MRRKIIPILCLVFLSASALASSNEVLTHQPLSEPELQKMRLITEAYMKMKKHYYREINMKDVEKLFFRAEVIAGTMVKNPTGNFEEDLDKLIYGTIEWMVREMRDSTDDFSRFIHKKYLSRVVRENLVSKFSGIGIEVEETDGRFYISKVYKDSSAEKEGVRVKDEIVRVAETEVAGRKLDEIKKWLQIPSGETVRLSLLREGQTQLFHVELLCTIIVIPSVQSEYRRKEKVGIIRIAEFRNETAREFEEHLDGLIKKKAKGLVIDLRGNDGGDMEQSVAIADLFLPEKTVVCFFLKRNTGRVEEKSGLPVKKLGRIQKVVVLVDDKTGSSSEILAGSLRFYNHFPLLGVKTKGSGSLKNTVALSDGSVLYLITSRTFLPDEKTFDAIGLAPDILVEKKEDQLLEAVKMAA